jgi:hypothetical protein
MTSPFRVLIPEGCTVAAVRSAYGAGLPLVLTARAVTQLADELGGAEAAMHWLTALVEHGPRPVAVNLCMPDGSTTTLLLGPRGWSHERLAGHLATMAPDLEALFGASTWVGAAR